MIADKWLWLLMVVVLVVDPGLLIRKLKYVKTCQNQTPQNEEGHGYSWSMVDDGHYQWPIMVDNVFFYHNG